MCGPERKEEKKVKMGSKIWRKYVLGFLYITSSAGQTDNRLSDDSEKSNV